MIATLPRRRLQDRLAALFSRVFARPAMPATQTTARDDTEDTQARLGFIQQWFAECPDMFANEHDVQCMMHLYAGRF